MKSKILELLTADHRFLLTGHTSPDGDCLGAQVALYHLLRALGRDCQILNPDPLAASQQFLCERTPIADYRSTGELPDFDVLVLLDCARLDRLGDMEAAVRSRIRDAESGAAPRVAVIDHHVGSENGDGEVSFVDSSAPATGAMVYDLFEPLGQTLNAAAAEGVFLSLVSDTGWFKYSNTDARTLQIAARMVEAGVEPDQMFDRLFRNNHPGSVEMLGRGLATHRQLLDGKLAMAALDRSMMDQAKTIGFDTDSVLDPLRSVAGVEVVVLLKELYQDGVKISLRASGDVDVQAIASHFGGGGHRKAAGATLNMPMVHAFAAVEEQVRQALQALEDRSG